MILWITQPLTIGELMPRVIEMERNKDGDLAGIMYGQEVIVVEKKKPAPKKSKKVETDAEETSSEA